MNEKLRSLVATLTERGVPHRVIELPGPAVRTRDVLDQVDVDPEQIVKTILFKRKSDGSTFAVAVPGKDRVSYRKIRALVRDHVSPLHPDEMRAIGWEPGECCPLSVPGPVFVDPAVFTHERINTGSGDLHFGIEFPPQAILELRDDARREDVREEAPAA